jgi:glutathione S-transferase
MITLYGFKGRSRAERVIWALNELEMPHNIIRLDYTKGETSTDDFSKLNPSGKVPVLIHNDQILTESVAIIQYLNNVSHKKIIPDNNTDRYTYDNRIMYLLTEIESYLWISDQSKFLSDLYYWPTDTINSTKTILTSNIKQIESWLDVSGYIVGDHFTAADIVAYHLLSWSTIYNINLSDNTFNYLNKLEDRAAFPPSMKNPSSPRITG